MNLRIADSAGLVAFLHRVIGETGHKVLATPEADVVQVGDAFFFHRNDPVTVGGPFSSVEALVRTEGVCRHPILGHATPIDRGVEIFEWAESFFRVDGSGAEGVQQFESLQEALEILSGLYGPHEEDETFRQPPAPTKILW